MKCPGIFKSKLAFLSKDTHPSRKTTSPSDARRVVWMKLASPANRNAIWSKNSSPEPFLALRADENRVPFAPERDFCFETRDPTCTACSLVVHRTVMSTPNVSRMVADRVAIANTVVSAIKIHGPEIIPLVEKTLFPNGVPNNLSVGDVLNALGARLEHVTDGLVKADQAHTNELADDDEVRRDRDERTVDMKDLLGALRSNLIRNYGSAVAGAYGFGATLPDDAPALLLLAGNVENLLRTRALVEPPKNKSLKVDAQLAADDIRDAAAALRAAVDGIEREKREAQLTLGAKNDALTSWGAADGTAAIFALVGRTDLAQRVRPTARRRAGLPDEETTNPTLPAPPNGNTGPATG
jgi:hypothetical protein